MAYKAVRFLEREFFILNRYRNHGQQNTIGIVFSVSVTTIFSPMCKSKCWMEEINVMVTETLNEICLEGTAAYCSTGPATRTNTKSKAWVSYKFLTEQGGLGKNPAKVW